MTEKILDRALKLKKQAEDAATTEAEAQAFAAALQRLLITHEISEAQLAAHAERTSKPEPIVEHKVDLKAHGLEVKRARVAWQEQLAHFVGQAHLCKFLIRRGSNDIWFVGTKTHAETATLAYAFLARAIEQIAQRAYHERCHELIREAGVPITQCTACGEAKGVHLVGVGKLLFCRTRTGHISGRQFTHPVQQARGFKSAFIDAFVSRIAERYRAELETVKREQDEQLRVRAAQYGSVRETADEAAEALREHGETASTALMVINNAMQRVEKYLDERMKGRRAASAVSGRRGSNAEGASRGRAAADRVALRPQKQLKGGA